MWVKIHRIYHETEPGSDSALQITSYHRALSEVLILTGPTFSALKGHHIYPKKNTRKVIVTKCNKVIHSGNFLKANKTVV